LGHHILFSCGHAARRRGCFCSPTGQFVARPNWHFGKTENP
jgi:hypothetical protein